MKRALFAGTVVFICGVSGCLAQDQKARTSGVSDAVDEAQTPRAVQQKRPEQKKTDQDSPSRVAASNAMPSSPVFKNQPEEGKMKGFDFYIDPLNAKKPREKFEDIMKADEEARPKVMDSQKQLLESGYNLTPKLDPNLKMTRAKPIVVGTTAPLKQGATWASLEKMSEKDINT